MYIARLIHYFYIPILLFKDRFYHSLRAMCTCMCMCVLCTNAHLVYKIHQTKIRLDVDCSYSRVHYLEINDPYRTWQESFKVDELENSTC